MRLFSPSLPTLALIFSCTLTYGADITFQKTLPASGLTLMTVCTNSGIVHIAGAAGDKVQISANVHKSNWHAVGNADEMKGVAANPPIHQVASVLHVGDKTTCGGSVLHDIDIDYEISIPRNTNVIVRSGAGSIRVESLDGFVHARTGTGDVAVDGIGHEEKSDPSKPANAGATAATLSDSSLTTGSGIVTAAKVRGPLNASSISGTLTASGNPTGDWALQTGSGAIHVQIDPSAKYTLDAEAGSGTIDSKLPAPVFGHITNGMLRGAVNGGGPAVKVYSGSGNLDLQ